MMNRREVMIAMAMAAASRSVSASNKNAPGPEHDWDWLIGNWDVWHRRLKERLANNNDWQEFNGKSVFWTTLNGLGNVDDNVVELPDGIYRGLSLRSFDPATRQWAIWWLDGRYPTRLDPPVLGRIESDTGTFIGQDTFKGRPVTVRFRWLDLHSKRPNWEQSFSPDGGKTWEVNWRNYFTRTNAKPTSLPHLDDAPRDFDFLVGTWRPTIVGSNNDSPATRSGKSSTTRSPTGRCSAASAMSLTTHSTHPAAFSAASACELTIATANNG